jgi:4-aminobutyrate aminotransferase / (S)-3-amino-2-methylpropionate transaminase / 5-aminovalerate transaminase
MHQTHAQMHFCSSPDADMVLQSEPVEQVMATNTALLARRQAAVPRGVAHATSIFAAKAENAEMWDVEGKRYVDFAGGIAVMNTGHRHPKVLAAIRKQLDNYLHTAFQVVLYEPYVALCEELNARAPFKGPAKTILFSTGSEAVENAIKIARAATGRPGVVAFTGGFHGRTMLTMALTGKVTPYKARFGPFPADIYHVPFPVPHHGVSVEQSLQALQFLFKADIEPARVAAVLIEPVQGEGGFHVAPPELMLQLRHICDQNGIVLIADEVQTGFGRTGALFAMEHYPVEPDLVAIAKSIAGGLPLSGVIGRAKIMDIVEPGGLGGTYGGNPVACAAALAVIEVIESEGLLERADVLGERIQSRLQTMARANDLVPIAAIRGLGGMIAFEIVKERGSYDPDPETTRSVTAEALRRGLVVLSCGVHGNVIRILVPLTATDANIEEGLEILEQAMRTAAQMRTAESDARGWQAQAPAGLKSPSLAARVGPEQPAIVDPRVWHS